MMLLLLPAEHEECSKNSDALANCPLVEGGCHCEGEGYWECEPLPDLRTVLTDHTADFSYPVIYSTAFEKYSGKKCVCPECIQTSFSCHYFPNNAA